MEVRNGTSVLVSVGFGVMLSHRRYSGIHLKLQIVARLQLTVSPVIFFHPHKGSIMIGLGITVSGTADRHFLDILCQLLR